MSCIPKELIVSAAILFDREGETDNDEGVRDYGPDIITF